ncbi:MAG TPA: YbjN domain-containing protein, partial [Micromonosporaceae bacterium]
MVPCLHLGQLPDAALAHVRAYQRHRAERDTLPLLADHLRFCALAGHQERGLRILAEQLHRLDQPYDEAAAMRLAAAGALVCRLAEAAGGPTGTIHRPGYGDRRPADLAVASLGRELVATARDYAGRFDARNGTSHQSGLVSGWLLARPLCAAPPLPDDELAGDAADPADPDRLAGGSEH